MVGLRATSGVCRREDWRPFFLLDFLNVLPSSRLMGQLPRTIDDRLIYRALDRGNNGADFFAEDADRAIGQRGLA